MIITKTNMLADQMQCLFLCWVDALLVVKHLGKKFVASKCVHLSLLV